MKKWFRFDVLLVFFALTAFLCTSCKENATMGDKKEMALNEPIEETVPTSPKKPLSKEFKSYWYAGNAEITSYKLEQARYGELREGSAVLIYVTEPFLPEIQVKADRSKATNVPVLKLNATKNYLTGIYPYSIMSSTFYPVHDNQHALKTSLSIQEWCGHVYAQLNNRDSFEFTSHSYFEGEADSNTTLDKALLENEIWTKIRIDPNELPLGAIEIVPSLEFFRVKHQDVKAFSATASLTSASGISSYTIDYGNNLRKLTINYSTEFPHTIESWTEEFQSGYGTNAKNLVSKGTKLKRIKTPYWSQNSNKDVILRDSLGI